MEAIFFAKFDDIVGPKIVCEVSCANRKVVPDGNGARVYEVDTDADCETPFLCETPFFDRVKDFIIAKKELCGSILTVSDDLTQCKVMSYPSFVENEKVYTRNALFFAFGFIFKEEMQTGAYEAVLKKLSHVMKSVEKESQFLSRPSNEPRIKEVLSQVISELSYYGESIVAVDEHNVLALKITPRLVDPTDVLDHQVPVQNRPLSEFVSKEWDLTIQQVIQYMDGERHVKLIAEESGVAVALVRRCIRQLLYFRCVRLVDIFQYSNRYTCTPRLVELAEDPYLQRDCLRFVWTREGECPSFPFVFKLYAGLQPCVSLADFCQFNSLEEANVNPRRLITFGVLNSFIRRVHTIPVIAPAIPKSVLVGMDSQTIYQHMVQEQSHNVMRGIARTHDVIGDEDELRYEQSRYDEIRGMMQEEDQQAVVNVFRDLGENSDLENIPLEYLVDGQHNMDSICTKLWCSAKQLEQTLQLDPDIVFINPN